MKMRFGGLVAILGLTLLGSVVRAQIVTSDYDRHADFSKYKTYAWTRGTELSEELNARVVRAIDDVLAEKGLVRVEPGGHPDILVAYHARLGKNLEDGWEAASVPPVRPGTLVVEIVDSRTNAIAWRSAASGDVKLSDTANFGKRIAAATEKMFEKYPAKP